MGEVGQVHRGRDEAVEERHDDSGRDRDADPLGRYFLRTFQHFPVRHAVEHDRHDDQHDAEEDKQRLAFRLAEVVDQHAQHERQSDTYRKGYRQSADRDGGRQQDVGGVEHDAAQKGAAEAVPVGLSQIGQKAASLASDAAEREGRQNREQQYADHVVPVEILVPPRFRGQFLHIAPRAPAKHRHDAENYGQRVIVYDVHGYSVFKVRSIFLDVRSLAVGSRFVRRIPVSVSDACVPDAVAPAFARFGSCRHGPVGAPRISSCALRPIPAIREDTG